MGIRGFYSDVEKSVTLVDHGADSKVETSTSVHGHQFVHVLQDREVELEAFRAPALTFDEGLPRSTPSSKVRRSFSRSASSRRCSA